MSFDAVHKPITLPEFKQLKYKSTIKEARSPGCVSLKALEKLVGYLIGASYAEPFGRSFPSTVLTHISRRNPCGGVRLEGEIKTALQIWV